MQYYVIKNTDTGMYWRGRGSNAWGKYFNQASIYRIKGQAEATKRELEAYGTLVDIVPIIIMEGAIVLDETV